METYKSCSPMNNYRNMNQRPNCGRPMNHMHNNFNRPMNRPVANDSCNNHSINQSCNDNVSHFNPRKGQDCDCNHNHDSNHRSDCDQNAKHNHDCNSNSGVINSIANLLNSTEDCRDNNPRLAGMPLANAFVPTQPWCKLYDKKEAICQGTAFPNLNLIFCGSRGRM